MPRTIEYLLRFDAPFIIGSGVAIPGFFDQVSVLSDDLPYIPASSIRGRVRASVLYHCAQNVSDWDRYQLCSGQAGTGETFCLPDERKGDYGLCPLCRLFGSPGGEVRRSYEFSAARVPAGLESLLRELQKTAPEGGLLLRRARNRRDYMLRKAREDAFFTLGVIDPVVELEGTVMEHPAHLRYNQETQDFDYGLLLLGMRLITELGGGRNRGYGRCQFLPKGETAPWDGPIRTQVEAWKNAKNRTDKGGP